LFLNHVFSPDGFLYDKEAILEYIIHQKTQIARKLKEYQKQKNKEESELEEIAKEQQRARTESFLRMEKSIVNPKASTSGSSASTISTANDTNPSTSGVGTSISNMSSGREKNLPSFWIPAMTPQSSKTKMKKPDTTVYCPMSGKPLKANHLIPIHFTPVKDSSNSKEVVIIPNAISSCHNSYYFNSIAIDLTIELC